MGIGSCRAHSTACTDLLNHFVEHFTTFLDSTAAVEAPKNFLPNEIWRQSDDFGPASRRWWTDCCHRLVLADTHQPIHFNISKQHLGLPSLYLFFHKLTPQFLKTKKNPVRRNADARRPVRLLDGIFTFGTFLLNWPRQWRVLTSRLWVGLTPRSGTLGTGRPRRECQKFRRVAALFSWPFWWIIYCFLLR